MTIQFKVLMILLKNVKKSLFNKCLKYCELYESNILKLFILIEILIIYYNNFLN